MTKHPPCRWFLEVQNIYYNGNKRRLLPKSNQPQLLESYFNCAATLMTSQLQTLALKVGPVLIDKADQR